MDRILNISVIIIFLNYSGLLSAQTIELTAERNHSTLGFSISIAGGFTRVTGKFTEYDMTIHFDKEDILKSQFDIKIDASSIQTGIPDRDEHLRNADFFDIEKYPFIEFKSEEIRKTEIGFEAWGLFSMHGISKRIGIPFQITKMDGNTIGFEIHTRINRMEYELGHNFVHSAIENFLSDTVDVDIYFWTKRKRPD